MSIARTIVVCAIAAVPILMTGCRSDRPRIESTRVESTGERLRRETAEAWQALKEYGYDRKKAYQDRVNELSSRFDRQMDSWRAAVRTETAEAKNAWSELQKDLGRKQEDFRAAFARVEAATEDTWEDVKRATSRAADELQAAFAEASARFQ